MTSSSTANSFKLNKAHIDQSNMISSDYVLDGNESIYILPKTYNGKTVTDLFPEFKYNSVLRFSKLFGVGRATSLPKIWKGSRKRKKLKSELDKSSSNENQSLESDKNNAKHKESGLNFISTNNQDDDVFKLFDEEFESKPLIEKDSEVPKATEKKF